MDCPSCNTKMRLESWAKQVAVNKYDLFDRWICKKCNRFKEVQLWEIDKSEPVAKKIEPVASNSTPALDEFLKRAKQGGYGQ